MNSVVWLLNELKVNILMFFVYVYIKMFYENMKLGWV